MQNGHYEVRVPDATDYWMEMVKCRHACPVHTDACGYVTSIAEGRYQDAYRIAQADAEHLLPELLRVPCRG